jgi:glycosyltransferase involved in cell wall biosynthesis
MVRVSVIFPTFNRSKWLCEAIDSVLAQRGVEFELMVLDHGSGPKTSIALDRYNDPRLRRFRYEGNRVPGQRCPWTFMSEQSTGDFIVFFSDDDIMLPGCLQQKAEILDSHPGHGFVFSAVELIDGAGVSAGRSMLGHPNNADMFDAAPFNELFVGNRICMPSVMFRRQYAPIFEHLPFCVLNDWAFWLEIAHQTKGIWLGNPTIKYRIHKSSDSNVDGVIKGEFYRNYIAIWQHWISRGHIPTANEKKIMRSKLQALAAQQFDGLFGV